MRGGRNKFGPIYRRDRALRRQQLSRQNELMSNVQHFVPFSMSYCSMNQEVPPTDQNLSSGRNSLGSSPQFPDTCSDTCGFKLEDVDIKPPIELLSGLVNSGLQGSYTSMFSMPRTASSLPGLKADISGRFRNVPTSRFPLTTSSSKTNVALELPQGKYAGMHREHGSYVHDYDTRPSTSGMLEYSSSRNTNQFLSSDEMSTAMVTQFMMQEGTLPTSTSDQPLYHLSQTSSQVGYIRSAAAPKVSSSQPGAVRGSCASGDSAEVQHFSSSMSYDYALQSLEGRGHRIHKDDAHLEEIGISIENIPQSSSLQTGLFQLIVDLQKNDQRLRDSYQKLRRYTDELLQQLANSRAELEQNALTEEMSEKIEDQMTNFMIQVMCNLCDQSLFVLVNWARRAHLFREVVVCSAFLLLLNSYCILSYFVIYSTNFEVEKAGFDTSYSYTMKCLRIKFDNRQSVLAFPLFCSIHLIGHQQNAE